MCIDFMEAAQRIVRQHRAEYRGRYVMFGGSSPSGSTTTTQTTNPWSGQQPYLTNQYNAAGNLYSNPSDYPQLYPGSTSGSQITPFNSTETSALGALANTGMNSPLMNSTENAQNYILNGGMLSQGNPYQQAELGSLNAQITPQLESQFTQGNAMNNPAAAYATSQGIGAADANILGQNYNTGEQQLTQTGLYAPQTYQSQLTGQNAALGAGVQEQNQSQDVLNSQIGSYNYNQQLPYNMLNMYASQIAGNPGSSSSLTSPYFSNTAQNMFSDALGVGSLGLGVASNWGTIGPMLAGL